MKINKTTSLKEIIGNNEKAIETIQNVNSSLKKIPLATFQKYSSSGVSLTQLSLIGNSSTNEILEKLETIGFEVELDENDVKETKKEEIVNLDNLKITILDVRPTIAAGNDPFKQIMQAIKILKDDETLQIINVFVPIPLINVLEGKGFKSWSNTISDNEFHTFFTKGKTSIKEEDFVSEENIKISFDDKLASFGKKIKEIDVRHLEMPEPMVTILEELETLPNDFVLFVNHKKVPQFLLPELKTRNYKWLSKEIEPGNTLFIVFK